MQAEEEWVAKRAQKVLIGMQGLWQRGSEWQVIHMCENAGCLQPWHVGYGTPRENKAGDKRGVRCQPWERHERYARPMAYRNRVLTGQGVAVPPTEAYNPNAGGSEGPARSWPLPPDMLV